MAASSPSAFQHDRAAMARHGDRLPLGTAVPVIAVLSALCWVALWQVARLVF